MVERRKSIRVNEAIEKLMSHARSGTVEMVPIEESYGRFIAEDIVADHDVPPFDRSPFDGFAVRSEDTQNSSSSHPVNFRVIGEIGAGSIFSGTVGDREAVRIMTGAQIPGGADAVVMFESVKEFEKDGEAFFTLKRRLQQGENISFTGEDTKEGSILVSKGTYINPGTVAVLATFGYRHVPVAKQPKVGIIATGSELLNIEEPLQPGKIRNSNAPMVHAQVIRAGGQPVYYGKFNDDFATCLKQVEEAIKDVDILITTGGVSVGDYDFLPAIYEKLGANVLFNKVGMRPGSVTTVAELHGKLLFGLSGNPSACYVGFELFARPAIRKFLQIDHAFPKKDIAVLGADFAKPNPFDRFVRGYATLDSGRLIASPTGFDKSNVVTSLAQANALIILPQGTRGYKKGMEVEVLLLEDQVGSSFEEFMIPERVELNR